MLTASSTAPAQDAGALVDALVREGVLTEQKAENIRADLQRDLAQTSAGKIKLSNSVTELKLYGDLRLRWQYNDIDAQLPDAGNGSQQSRYRFRLRLNTEAKLGRDYFAGFSLGTGQPSDSEEQTFENGFDDYNIFITKAYLGWQPSEWLTVVGGKQKNPFYTTDLIWDPDITPTGLVETISLHKLPWFGGAGGPTGGEAKESKSIADFPKRSNPWEVTLVAGQFVFDDNNEFSLDSDLKTDAYLFVEQLIATYKWSKDTSLTVAPAFYTYTAADLSGLTNANAFTDAAQLGSTSSTRTTASTVLTTTDTTNAAGITSRVTQPTTVTTVVTTVTNLDGTQTVTTNSVTTRAGAASPAIGQGNIGRAPNSLVTNAATVASLSTATPATLVNGFPAVSGETRQLHILTAPGDFSFKLGSLKSKFYWDFAYNTGGKQRFEDTYQLLGGANGDRFRYSERDGVAWLAGLQFGETKKKGDWQAYVNYRETGIASVDPNINDSNFGLSELNTRGFKLGVAYQLADAVVLSVTGYWAWNLNEDLIGGRATNSALNIPLGAGGVAEANESRVLQVDLSVKF